MSVEHSNGIVPPRPRVSPSSGSKTLFGSDSLIVRCPSDAGDDAFTSMFVGSAIRNEDSDG
jgi:hypothetical protein